MDITDIKLFDKSCTVSVLLACVGLGRVYSGLVRKILGWVVKKVGWVGLGPAS